MLMPTSRPTINMMDKKQKRIFLLASKERTAINEVCETPKLCSFILEKDKRIIGNNDMPANSRKLTFQSPNIAAAVPARIGPNKEEIDFISCPVVRMLAVFSFVKSEATSGFNETCNRVLLIPSKENPSKTKPKL